ncbi:MAG: hypothetical protein IPK58_11890 [Acidobacteria bacterium]|nr:hypothetical protein [Acidobacteriota bacterium]
MIRRSARRSNQASVREPEPGFGRRQANRQGYGLTEKDSTGLNHTWFRKNENRAGRWTSPDPYNGSASVGNPQSWNRYSYVENQPTNFVDPSGLLRIWSCTRPFFELGEGNRIYGDWSCQLVYDDGAAGTLADADLGTEERARADGAESQNKPKTVRRRTSKPDNQSGRTEIREWRQSEPGRIDFGHTRRATLSAESDCT